MHRSDPGLRRAEKLERVLVRTSPRHVGLLALLLVSAGSLLVEPAAGDWLVTHDGAGIETRGAWRVTGNLVVFDSAAGVLSSIRLTEVDLAASKARSEAELRKASEKTRVRPPEPAEKPKARFVLTDADVGHVEETPLGRPQDSGADGELDEASSQTAPPKERGRAVAPEDNPLEVVSWDAVLGAGASGVTISGVIKNPSEFFASGVSIKVRVLDLNGEEIASKSGKPEVAALAPGEQTSFRISLPDVFVVGNALFEITSFNAVVSKSSGEG